MKKFRLLIATFIIIFVAFITTKCVFAEDNINNNDGKNNVNIDITRLSNLDVEFKPNGCIPKGVEFRLYKIGNVSSKYNFTKTPEFERYPVDLNHAYNNGWNNVAGMLSNYVKTDGIAAKYTCNINDYGYACFKNIEAGVYLVIGNEFVAENKAYTPVPFIISLPFVESNGEFFYYIKTSVKYEERDKDTEKFISRRVVLFWDDLDEKLRTKSIRVCLLRDGIVYDSVELNDSNNWRYTWDNLSTKYTWEIIEDIANNEKDPLYKKYYSTFENEGATFIIKKIYRPAEPVEPIEPKTEEPAKLPATGVLWWPVPILIVIGILLILYGLIKNKGDKNE